MNFKKRKMEQLVLEKLINKQLKPYNKTYQDVNKTNNWFMKYYTTKDEQSAFMKWAVNYLVDDLNMSTKLAEVEVSWFILQWGLPLKNTAQGDSVGKVL